MIYKYMINDASPKEKNDKMTKQTLEVRWLTLHALNAGGPGSISS